MTDDTQVGSRSPASSWVPRVALSLALAVTLAFFFLDGFVLGAMDSIAVALVALALLLVIGLFALSGSALPRGICLRTTAWVIAGTVITGTLGMAFGFSAVLAAASVGVAGGLLPRLTRHVTPADAAALYVGSFAGMTSPLVLLGPAHLIAAGLVTGLMWSVVREAWIGVGGKMGTVTFAAVGLTAVVAVSIGGINSMPTTPMYSPLDGWAILGASLVSAALTHWLAYRLNWGITLGSAVPSAIVFLAFFGVSGSVELPNDALAAAWFGASFVGMTSPGRLLQRWWTLPLMAVVFAFLLLNFQAHLAGLGGDLGATAAAAVIIVTGLESVVRRIASLRPLI